MRHSSNSNKSKRPRRRLILRILRAGIIVFLVIMGAGIGLMGGLVYKMNEMVPASPGQLDFRTTDSTRIFSSDGVALAVFGDQQRSSVKLTEVPKALQDATVAVEDKRFYEHMGFDPVGITRALVANLRGRQFDQGASTITQQLARNVFLSNKKTLARKLQEIALAMALERKYTKQQILEFYLNEVYYGSGAYGVESAAHTYFGKPVSRLSLTECATIAGLTQRPTGYSPFNNLEAAIGRRKVVLRDMLEQSKITREEYDEADNAKLSLAAKPQAQAWKAPYFVTYVIQQVGEAVGEANLYHGGLQIYTTLDYKMQQKAERAVREGVDRNHRRRVGQGALVSLDPKTGYIRAMVGGTDFYKNQFNVATQGRPQPGSTFKAFVYTAAFQNGYDPDSRVMNKKIRIRAADGGWKDWPENYDQRYSSSKMRVREAIKWSVNCVAVRVTQDIGVEQVIKYARALGITSTLEPNLSLALGSASVSPLEMARAYCAFDNGGKAVQSLAVTRITTTDNSVIKEYQPSLTQVMTESTAERMDDMFRGVVQGGTGKYVNRRIANARGKTGTTNDLKDAWFIGYTPELVTAVWLGNDRPKPMPGVSGGFTVAPVWCEFMSTAIPLQREFLAKKPAKADAADKTDTKDTKDQTANTDGDWVRLRICDTSSLIRSKGCPTWHRQRFRKGDEPTAYCDVHGTTATEPDATTPPSNNENPANTNNSPSPPPEPSRPPAEPVAYTTVYVCADSGDIANTNCPHVVRKRFREDQAPSAVCSEH